MSAKRTFLAIDLGAESGRGILGHFDGSRLTLEEANRFPNGGIKTLDSLHWDVLRLYAHMLDSLRAAGAKSSELSGVGVDTWGVDFALLGRDGVLLGNPRHYRDPHTEAFPEAAFAVVPREEIFRQTGIQFMRFNSLYQLLALKQAGSAVLDVAKHLLMIPDLFHYWFAERSQKRVLRPYHSYSLQWAASLASKSPHLFGGMSPISQTQSYAFHMDAMRFADWLQAYAVSQGVEFISDTVAAAGTKPVVVVTHHSPSKLSIKPRYQGDYHMNGGYSSAMEDFILDRPGI
ncbi:MAG: hypothetical protein EBV06_13105, partial [Planctomycetia bacterium]|nr:hypothetical protein [Planctomycetia bacterium]